MISVDFQKNPLAVVGESLKEMRRKEMGKEMRRLGTTGIT